MIVRSPRPVTQYTIVANELVRDHRLSWKARGLLVYLLSLPDNWQTSADELTRRSPDGRHSVLTGLQELETAGYLQRVRTQRPNGQWQTRTLVFDHPTTTQVWTLPESGFPTSENQTPKEVTTKKEPVGVKSVDANASTELCAQCQGYGTTVMDGHLVRCEH